MCRIGKNFLVRSACIIGSVSDVAAAQPPQSPCERGASHSIQRQPKAFAPTPRHGSLLQATQTDLFSSI